MAQASDTAQPQTPPRRDNTATVTGTNRLKALSHPTRLRILTVMSDTKPVTVGQIAEQLGESAGTVSYHLKQLEKAGFVTQTPSPDGDNRRSCWLAAQKQTGNQRGRGRRFGNGDDNGSGQLHVSARGMAAIQVGL